MKQDASPTSAEKCPVCTLALQKPVWIKEAYRYYYCRACDVFYVLPRPSLKDLSSIYKASYYADYEKHKHLWAEDYARSFNLLTQFVKPGKILEIGCGLGTLLNLFHEKGWDVTGIETSEYAALRGRNEYGLNIINAELERAQFKPESFDQVLIWDVLAHVPQPELLISAAYGLLEKGGKILIRTPVRGFADFFLERLFSRFSRAAGFIVHYPYQINLFTEVGIKKMVQKAGFKCLGSYPVPRLLFKHPFSIKRSIAGFFQRAAEMGRQCGDGIVLIAEK